MENQKTTIQKHRQHREENTERKQTNTEQSEKTVNRRRKHLTF
jgi:hypothetical protein